MPRIEAALLWPAGTAAAILAREPYAIPLPPEPTRGTSASPAKIGELARNPEAAGVIAERLSTREVGP